MKLLLDTHMLLWAAAGSSRMPVEARGLVEDLGNELVFSVASLWEVAIKSSLAREDFDVDAAVLRRGLLDNGFLELPIASEHAVAVASLPPIHRDPFDRMLVAQAQVEGVVLLTCDPRVAEYAGPIRLCRK